MKVLSYSENTQIAGELLTAAKSIGQGEPVAAALLGQGVMAKAQEILGFGAEEVYVVEDSSLAVFQVEPYVTALAHIVQQTRPSAVLIGATRRGRELAPRLATRLKTGAVADCIGLRVEDGQLLMDRVAYAGKAVATLTCSTLPVVCSIKPHAFEAVRQEAGKKEVMRMDLTPREARCRIVGREERPKGGVNLSEAKIIVSVGRGLKKKEDLAIIRELADAMGAEIGCSRPLSSDLGWLPEEHHIGISGISVKPSLYIAVGISGQLHHLVGIQDSGIIVAINTDKDAPIFSASDYCVVGDLYRIIPELTKVLKGLVQR